MARRRMLTVELIDSDRFMDLPVQVQMLYVNLSMHGDDEGFVASPRRIARFYGGDEGLQMLEDSNFVIRFPSGVLAIVDWHLNNTIRKDRSMTTIYKKEREQLWVVDGKYVPVEQVSDNQLTNNSQPFDNQTATQNRIEQNRIDQNIIDKNSPDQSSEEENSSLLRPQANRMADQNPQRMEEGDNTTYDIDFSGEKPTFEQVKQFCQREGLTHVNPFEFWTHYAGTKWRDKDGEPVQNWKALARSWNAGNQRKATSEPEPEFIWTIGTNL